MQEKLRSILNSVLAGAGLDTVARLDPTHNLKNDLELDSISLAELIAVVDAEFSVDINGQGDMVETVGDILSRLPEAEI